MPYSKRNNSLVLISYVHVVVYLHTIKVITYFHTARQSVLTHPRMILGEMFLKTFLFASATIFCDPLCASTTIQLVISKVMIWHKIPFLDSYFTPGSNENSDVTGLQPITQLYYRSAIDDNTFTIVDCYLLLLFFWTSTICTV